MTGGALVGRRALGWAVLFVGAVNAYVSLRAFGHEGPERYWIGYLVPAALGILAGALIIGISSQRKQ